MRLVYNAPVSEASFSSVHKPNFVQIFPALIFVIVHRHELDKVIGQEILAEFYLGMLGIQVG